MRKAKAMMVLVLTLTLLTAVTATAGPVLDRIVQKGELVVGTSGNQPPLTAKTKEGKIIGVDADLSRVMAAAMGVELKFEVMPFAELLPALETGKIDMILSGMTITPERNMRVAFAGPYYITGKGILTKSDTVASFQDPTQINTPDFILVALKGSTSQMFVQKIFPKAKLMTTETLDEAIDILIKDKAHALVADYPTCAVAAFRHSGKGLAVGKARFTFEPLGIALSENDLLLVNLVQNILGMLKGTGDLDKLIERWFEDSSWMKELP